ncbi:MAG: hypothetical protein Q8K89_08815, partial [Actinomycetota bacterium]|nr:hypothetical protein [Actinomycetota bacterium]
LFPIGLLVGISQVFYSRGLISVIPALLDGSTQFDEFTRLQLWASISNLVAPLMLVARLYVSSAIFAAAPGMLSGRRYAVKEFLRGGLARFGWLLLVAILVSMATSTGFLFLIVPGVFLWARLSIAHVACVVEGAPLDRSFARSWALTSGRVWRTLGFGLGLAILTFTLESAVDSPAVLRQIISSVTNPEAMFAEISVGWKVLEGVLSATALSIVYPFVELAWFFYYLDLRARHEGMDLVQRAARLTQRAS